MQTITTKVLPATNTKPTRIKATSSSGISCTCGVDKFEGMENAHRGTAYALMLKLKWTGLMAGGDTKEGMVWVFFDEKRTIVNDAERVIVNIHTGNAAFADKQAGLARIFGMLKDAADLEDLHSKKIYDVNGNDVGYINIL